MIARHLPSVIDLPENYTVTKPWDTINPPDTSSYLDMPYRDDLTGEFLTNGDGDPTRPTDRGEFLHFYLGDVRNGESP